MSTLVDNTVALVSVCSSFFLSLTIKCHQILHTGPLILLIPKSIVSKPWQFPSDTPLKPPPSPRRQAHTASPWCCPGGRTRPLHGCWGIQTLQTWGRRKGRSEGKGWETTLERYCSLSTEDYLHTTAEHKSRTILHLKLCNFLATVAFFFQRISEQWASGF